MSEEAKKYIALEWVYIGLRIGKSGKRVYCWAQVNDLSARAIFNKKVTPASVGGVYLFHQTEDGDSFLIAGENGPRYVRRYEDPNQIHTWAAQEEAAVQEFAMKTLSNKASKVEPLEEFLDKIRKVTIHLNKTEKRAFITRLIQEIMS